MRLGRYSIGPNIGTGRRRGAGGGGGPPPLAVGAKIAILGDSIAQYGNLAQTGGINPASPGLTISSGGTGYSVNDVLTAVGGVGVVQAAQVRVSSVSAGVITGVALIAGATGSYETNPASPNAMTGGTGSGASIGFTSWARTAENQGDGELNWALAMSPRGKAQIWIDHTAIASNLVPAYGEACAVDPLWRGYNLGLSGDTTTGFGLRVNAAINTTASVIIYTGGTNVGVGDSPVGTVTANIASAVGLMVAAGKRVILGTIRPRRVAVSPTGSQINPASMDRIIQINAWIRANCASLGAVLWDPWEALRDRAYNPGDTLYGTDAAGMTRDNVHLTPLGAYTSGCSTAYGAIPLKDALAQVISAGTWFNADPTVSNLLANGSFTGTGGTANNGCSGTMPNNTFVSNVSGAAQPVTGVASVAANADTGGQLINLVLTSTGAGTANTFNTIRMSHTNPATGFTSTDYVQAVYEIEVDGAAVMPCFQATLGQSSTIAARGLGQTTGTYNNEPYPPYAGRLWIQTEPLLVGARTSLNPRLDMIIRQDLAGSTTIKVRRALLRIVPSPVTEFPWSP